MLVIESAENSSSETSAVQDATEGAAVPGGTPLQIEAMEQPLGNLIPLLSRARKQAVLVMQQISRKE